MLDEKNMLENKKRYQRYSIIAIVVILVIVIGISFAYFASTINKNAQTNVIVGFDGGYEFKTTSSNETVNVVPDELAMFQGSSDKVAALGNHTIDVDLTALDETGYYCTFDFVWQWNSGQYHASAEGAKEFTVSSVFGEFQVPDYGSSDNVLFSSSISATGSVPTNKEYNFTLNFYNLANIDQSGHSGKSYNGSIKIDNVECDRNLSGKVLSLEQNIDKYTDYTSSQDSSIYRVVDQNGVRYEGKDPDNYVYFNGNEKWRIIGTFDGLDIGLTEGKKYTKIIRSTKLDTSYAWDDNENDWVNSTLNTYLNGSYLSGISTKDMIVNATWYLRGTSDYQDLYSQDWYEIERISGQAGYRGGTQYEADTETKGAIGIMYPSDYGYAAYGSSCDNRSSMSLYNYEGGCAAVDWLATDSINNTDWEWLISPNPDHSSNAFIVGGSVGGYVFNDGVDGAYAVRPALYLEDTVTITGGNGSSSSPYLLDMPAKTLSDTVLAQESAKDYISSQDSSVYKITHETVEHEGQTLDAGIRYEGKDPDNYVTFNNETWRIIGVFEGSTIGLEPGKQYTKIIRNTRIGLYEWDNDNGTYENDWTNSTLNTYLNGTYLSNMTDSEKIAKYNGQYSTWHLRGTSNYSGLYSQDWYVTERYTGQAGYRNETQYAADIETTGAIGLMYPSDYGYAAYGTSCDNNSSMTLYNYEGGCAGVDWLATDSISNGDREWLISPDPVVSYVALLVGGDSGGSVYDNDLIISASAVRPTLYLSSDIMITGGTGSKTNPYTLDGTFKTLSDEVISKETDSDYTSSQDGTAYRVAYQNGYRYSGKNPDNYVTFNGETAGWRIIGTFSGEDLGLNDSYYTKIIKDETIGTLTWSNAETILNGDYYNGTGSYASTGITDDKSRSMIAKVKWYKGASSNIMNSVGEFTYDEKGSLGINNTTNPSVSENYINLMYASDIVGSIYGRNGCGNAPLDALDTSCNGYLWIPVYPQEWTLTPYATSNSAFMFYYGYLGTGAITSSYDVRPTLYLKSDVKVAGGSGTKTNPYILDY